MKRRSKKFFRPLTPEEIVPLTEQDQYLIVHKYAHDEGYQKGYRAGRKHGEDLGYNKGFSVAKATEWDVGYASGLRDGTEIGISRGRSSVLSEMKTAVRGAIKDALLLALKGEEEE